MQPCLLEIRLFFPLDSYPRDPVGRHEVIHTPNFTVALAGLTDALAHDELSVAEGHYSPVNGICCWHGSYTSAAIVLVTGGAAN